MLKIEDVKTPADFAEYLRTLAMHMLKAEGQVPNWMFASNTNSDKVGANVIVPYETTSAEMKRASLDLIAENAERIGATVRGHMGEVWTAKALPGDERAPSQRDDREEAVLITAGDGKGGLVVRQFKIDRSGDEVRLGDEIPLANVDQFSGGIVEYVRGMPTAVTKH